MRRLVRFTLSALAVGALTAGSGCDGPAPASRDDPDPTRSVRLVLTGSSTVAPLVSEIARRFESINPGVRVDVQAGGSSRGLADLRSGVADIGMVSRALDAADGDLIAIPIARDGVGVIVHAANPVRSLAEEQLRAIYLGNIEDWVQVGGRRGAITVVTKADGRATLEVFSEYFDLTPETVAADVVIGDNQQGIKTVAGDPGAIGYVSIGAAEHEIGVGTPIRLLTVGTVGPTLEEVAAGRYPVVRPLNLVVTAPPSGPVKAFLEFARSHQVDDLVARQRLARRQP